jgi:hypothetical protein
VAVNLGAAAATYRYTGLAALGDYRDAFTGATVALGAEGTLTRPANGYLVLTR